MRKKLYDLIFIHPPASFNESSPILDADVKYGGQFSSFPVGFFNMSHNLEQSGYKVAILNLAERYIQKKPKEDFEDLIKSFLNEFSPKIVGIDMHFMVHILGAIETARLIRKHAKKTKIILGGMTASIFADEIMEKYDEILDGVMIGECDECIVDSVREFTKKTKCDLYSIPNLVFKKGNKVKKNKITIPDLKQNVSFTRYNLLLKPQLINPDRTLITMYRGCRNECNYCGGAKNSYSKSMKRKNPIYLEPEIIIKQIISSIDQGRDKIYLYGDMRYESRSYINRFFKALYEANIKDTNIVFEFFYPTNEAYLTKWTKWKEKTNNTLEVTFSPESGSINVRKQFKHKKYSNEVILNHCELVMSKFKIPQSTYFSFGLPYQTEKTIKESLKLADKIIEIFARNFKKSDLRHEILAYCFFQIPDPCSLLFSNPDKFEWKLSFNGFEGIKEMLFSAKDWTEAIGFTTPFFKDKKEIINTYLYIKKNIVNLYKKHGLITK